MGEIMTSHSSSSPKLLLLIIIAMASPLALNLFIPAMPDAVVALHTDIATMQLTYTLFLLTLAFGQLISGPLADYFGRYPVLSIGLAIHFLGCLLAILSNDIQTLIAARVLQALGGSACMSMARTMMLDIYGRERAASKMSYLVMAIAISQAIAPTIGGYLNLYFGWHTIFYLSAIIALSVWLINSFQLSETCKNKTTSLRLSHVLKQYWQVLHSRQYLGYALSSTFIACAFYLFIGSMPYIVVHDLSGSSADFGVWFLAVALAFMAGSFCSGLLSKTKSIDSMIILGNRLSLLGASILFIGVMLVNFQYIPLNYALLFTPMAVLTFGRGLSQPNAQSGAISSSPLTAGTASGLLGFIQLIIGAATAQLVPELMNYGLIYLAFGIFIAPILSMLSHKMVLH